MQMTQRRGLESAGFDDHPPVMLTFAANWPLRIVLFRVAGTALILSAAGIWLFVDQVADGQMVMFKLGTSLFFFLCGLALLMRNHVDNQPDAYFDPIRQEIRVLQKDDSGRPRTILRRSYDSIGGVEFFPDAVEVFDLDGSLLMRLATGDDLVRNSLRAQLGGLAKPDA